MTFALNVGGCARVCQAEKGLRWRGTIQEKQAAMSTGPGGLDNYLLGRLPLAALHNESLNDTQIEV